MSGTVSHTTEAEGKCRSWERVVATAHLHEYEGARKIGMSQRQYAEQAGIPRTTLHEPSPVANSSQQTLVNFRPALKPL